MPQVKADDGLGGMLCRQLLEHALATNWTRWCSYILVATNPQQPELLTAMSNPLSLQIGADNDAPILRSSVSAIDPSGMDDWAFSSGLVLLFCCVLSESAQPGIYLRVTQDPNLDPRYTDHCCDFACGKNSERTCWRDSSCSLGSCVVIRLQKDLVVAQRCLFVQRSIGPRGERSTIRRHDGETINDWRVISRPVYVLSIVDGHCDSRYTTSGLILVVWGTRVVDCGVWRIRGK